MPMELIVISLMRASKWINVLMLNSPDDDNSEDQNHRIDVSANGIRWIERDFEQFTPLGKYFEINTNPDAGISVDTETNNATALKLSLLTINDAALQQQTVDVGIEALHVLFNEFMAWGLHCSNCNNELVAVRRYKTIRPMPIYTLEPLKYFCPRDKLPIDPSVSELYYALNYIVVSPLVLAKRIKHHKGHIFCGRCLHLVGETLGPQVAVQLYVDTLLVAPYGKDDVQLPEGRLEQLFGSLTPSQLMLHLLQDAVPISEEKTRLFLKTVRSDGQLHYMLLLVDTSQLHLLRSKYYSMEQGFKFESSDNNNSSSSDSEPSYHQPSLKRTRLSVSKKPIHEIEVRGYRGCRVSYYILCNDEELSAHHDIIEQWRDEGTPMLRISYLMMMDLFHELTENELLVTTMERTEVDMQHGYRTSYIIYEPENI